MFRFPSKLSKIFLVLFIALSVISLNACKKEKPAPKYVFLFIGDGVSFAQRHLAQMSADAPLLMNSLPVQGVMTTEAADSAIPDAASATSAFATGQKVPNGVISMLPETSEKLPLITELAAKNTFNVAVLTTASVDDATPAAFYARSEKRTAYYDIATQVPESSLTLLAGAKFKRPRSFKKDDLDVVLKRGGYKIFTPSKDNVSYPSGKVAVTYDSIPYTIDARKNSPDLAEMVQKAIAKLGTEKSFFIVAESAKIDAAAHMHDTATMLEEMKSFDAAVKKAYDFYKAHPNDTLLIVTGDHETGGLVLGANNAKKIDLSVFEPQKKSMVSFRYDVMRFKSRHASLGVLEDFMPTVTRVFGLKMFSASQKEALKLKAEEGDEKAAEDLEKALTPAETAILREGLRYSMTEKSRRPETKEYKAKYGNYEPMPTAVAAVLNKRAGIGYATFEHSAVPVPVSAVGYRSDLFSGSYPNTDMFSKLLNVMGIPLPPPPAVPAPELPAAEAEAPQTETPAETKAADIQK